MDELPHFEAIEKSSLSLVIQVIRVESQSASPRPTKTSPTQGLLLRHALRPVSLFGPICVKITFSPVWGGVGQLVFA